MLNEVIDNLNIKPNGIYVDLTVGGAGHSTEILRRIKNGKLICVDQDEEALSVARDRLLKISDNVLFYKSNFCFCTIALLRTDFRYFKRLKSK